MPGPAPKPPEQRRNRVEPSRGEWVEIPQVSGEKPPRMPKSPKGGWAEQTKRAWQAWWEDGASVMWGPADVDSLNQLLELHHQFSTMDNARGMSGLAGEIRQRMDGLGLSPKGKQDRRWRVVADELEQRREADNAKPSPYGHLRPVNDAVAGA